jgi:hypothetical protein
MARLIVPVPDLKHPAARFVVHVPNLRVSEFVVLKVSHICRERMASRVEKGKGRRDQSHSRSGSPSGARNR